MLKTINQNQTQFVLRDTDTDCEGCVYQENKNKKSCSFLISEFLLCLKSTCFTEIHSRLLQLTKVCARVCVCGNNTKPAIEPCTFVKDTKPAIDWLWFVLQKIDSFFI